MSERPARTMANFHFQLIVSVSFLLNLPAKCSAASASPEVLTGFPEEEVVLSCWNSSLVDSCYRGRWIKNLTNTTIRDIFKWPTVAKSLPSLPEKVVWKEDGEGNECLFLKNLEQSDAGSYTEEVWKGWNLIQEKEIHLKVKDCKILQTVKAAPGFPTTLRCSTTSESSNITWAMLKGNKPVTKTETNNGSLVFRSVTITDGGWYRCSFMFRQRQRCYDINLLIQADNSFVVTTVPVAVTTTDQAPEVTQKVLSSTSTPLVASVVSVMIIIASALTAMIIYFKFQTQKSPSQSTRQSPVYTDFYENISLPESQDYRKTDNSLYNFEEENVSTFQY